MRSELSSNLVIEQFGAFLTFKIRFLDGPRLFQWSYLSL